MFISKYLKLRNKMEKHRRGGEERLWGKGRRKKEPVTKYYVRLVLRSHKAAVKENRVLKL